MVHKGGTFHALLTSLPVVDLAFQALLLLFVAAFIAGFIDSIAGGGGLITIPAMLIAGIPPLETLGTNKLQSMFGAGSATLAYARRGHVDLRKQLPMAVMALPTIRELASSCTIRTKAAWTSFFKAASSTTEVELKMLFTKNKLFLDWYLTKSDCDTIPTTSLFFKTGTCWVLLRNISIIALPAKCPELNPVENIWQFMRDNWLSNRVFTSYDNIVDHCCEAWNKLIDQPWRIISIGMRDWAHRY